MSYHRLQIGMLFLLFFFIHHLDGHAQSYLPQKKEFFKQSSQNIKGRIRDLNLIDRGSQQDILLCTREGVYPDWTYKVTLMQENQGVLVPVYEHFISQDMHYYAAIDLPEGEKGVVYWNNQSVTIHASENNQWTGFKIYQWKHDQLSTDKLIRLGDPVFVPVFQDHSQSFILWMHNEFIKFNISQNQIALALRYQIKLPVYFSTSHNTLPLDLKFSAKQSLYYPSLVKGKYKNQNALFFHWMEHVSIFALDSAKLLKELHFNTMTENERDSGQAWSHLTLLDLNHDGHMDYIVNTSLGSPTQMKSKSRLYLGLANDEVDMKGIAIKTDADRASGIIAYDLDHDHAYEYVAASAQFNIWTILKALTQKQVDITFSIFDSNATQQNFKEALSQKKLTFGFSLSDLNLEGFLPNINHDFNADGLNDVFYAQNDRKLSIIFQNPDKVKHFSEKMSATYSIKVPKHYRLGDINGDQKTDVILFSTKPQKNSSFTVLLNQYEP